MSESYYDKNRDRILSYQKQYYKENKEKRSSYYKKYYEKNKQYFIEVRKLQKQLYGVPKKQYKPKPIKINPIQDLSHSFIEITKRFSPDGKLYINLNE